MEVQNVSVVMLPDGRMNPLNAANYMGLSPKTLEKWRMEGIGPNFVKLGGRVFYFKSDLDEYLSGRVVSSTAQARRIGA
jgi:predicted site-specific integrase-resolvase